MNPDQLVLDLARAWTTTDEAERRALLDRVWADDGVYCMRPTGRVVGRDALAATIAAFQRQEPGVRIPVTSGVDVNHGFLRFRWAMVDARGNVILEGFDVGEIGPDGRLKSIVTFGGPFPPIPDGWPDDLARREK